MNKGVPRHLFDTVVDNEGTCKWQRFTPEARIFFPSYKLPFERADFEEEIKQKFKCDDLCYGYVPLGFYTVPMWPYEREDCKSVYDTLFVQCVECDRRCVGPCQLCLQFIFPRVINLDRSYQWTWIPRVRCSGCTHGAGVEKLEELVYFPLAIRFHAIVAKLMDISNAAFALCNKKVARHCFVCEAPISKTQHKRSKKEFKVPLCRLPQCAQSHALAKEISPAYVQVDPVIPGLFRMFDIIDVFRENTLDVNGALQLQTCDHCKRRGKPSIKCNQCHRVTFCSVRCKKIQSRKHAKHCNFHWESTFDRANVVIQKE